MSVSIGLSAVYLIGGATKDVPPKALLLRSGDAVLQGGLSRGYVHGVPRIVANSFCAAAADAADAADAAANPQRHDVPTAIAQHSTASLA